MIIALRTDSFDSELHLLQSNGEEIDNVVWHAGRELSVHLLTKLEEIIQQNSTNLSDIEGLVVYKGPGSFTGLRIGIAVANSLAYGLQKPVVGSSGENWIDRGIKEIKNMHLYTPVQPLYGADPHITRPKK